MHAVYRLVDPRNQETFYVGTAEDVYARFLQHLRCDSSNPAKDSRIQELKTANIMVVMETLQLLPDINLALKREAYWIKHFYDLGAPLTNQILPLMQEKAQKVPQRTLTGLRPGMPLEEQEAFVKKMLDAGMSRRKILAKVDGYIPHDLVRQMIGQNIKDSLRMARLAKPLAATLTQEELLDTVSQLLDEGHNQDQIIEKVWKITKGGKPKYYAARDEYRACVALIKERRQQAYEQAAGE
jgi:predicted GIY-YIG superfamily endonuclease